LALRAVGRPSAGPQSHAPAKHIIPPPHDVPSGAFVHAVSDWRGWQRAHAFVGDAALGATLWPSMVQFGKWDVQTPLKHASPVPHAAPSVMLDQALVDVAESHH
jgi:hypothetical protein